MLDALGPGEIGDVNQPVDTVLDLDEGAELGEVADLAAEPGAEGVLLYELSPRVGLDLLQAQADAVGLLVDPQHLALDRLADLEDLRGMLDLLGP